jgi:hypothetical protein
MVTYSPATARGLKILVSVGFDLLAVFDVLCFFWVWLDSYRTCFVKAKSLLKPYPEELMDAHDVSPIVNSAKSTRPECIRPVLDDEVPRTRQLPLFVVTVVNPYGIS